MFIYETYLKSLRNDSHAFYVYILIFVKWYILIVVKDIRNDRDENNNENDKEHDNENNHENDNENNKENNKKALVFSPKLSFSI